MANAALKLIPNGIKIEKGIPLQSRVQQRYPFDGMEVGDSFFVDGIQSSAAIRGSIDYAMRKRGWRFAVRKDPVKPGCRVWRVE